MDHSQDPWQPQVFNMATSEDTDEEGQVSRATAAQHRIRAQQRPDITRWEKLDYQPVTIGLQM